MLLPLFLHSCFSSSLINTVGDPNFTEDGYLTGPDTVKTCFEPQLPNSLAFYVETSGSMNGFFRANRPNAFKRDVWSIVSNFGNTGVNIFSNAGASAHRIPVVQFQTKMNQGQFVSSVSTDVPKMLETILKSTDFEGGEVAALISDLKYDPVGQKAKNVLLDQYSTDIRNLVAGYPGIAFSVIGAYSEYFGANGQVAEEKSPYYYMLIGKDIYLSRIRNSMITLLGEDYIDDMEMGFDYKSPKYDFGLAEGAVQLEEGVPTFVQMDEDTCRIALKLDLSSCRWKIVSEDVLRRNMTVKAVYGSTVNIDKVKLDVDNHYEKNLYRRAVATVTIAVSGMPNDSEVIEWTLDYPEFEYSPEYCYICYSGSGLPPIDVNDLSRSFSLFNLTAGIFGARQNHWDKTPDHILVSRNY